MLKYFKIIILINCIYTYVCMYNVLLIFTITAYNNHNYLFNIFVTFYYNILIVHTGMYLVNDTNIQLTLCCRGEWRHDF